MRRIYVDCDGVLANFDKKATQILRGNPRTFEDMYGSESFWAALNHDGNFFKTLELMPGAAELMDGLKGLGLDPWVLTGCPSQIPEGHLQKQEWIAAKFGRSQPVITCKSRDKSNFCRPGDMIIDDYPKHIDAWVEKGGVWFLHVSVDETLRLVEEWIND